jgi:hypothetical protein
VSAGVIEFVRRLIKYRAYSREEREHDLQHSETAIREWESLDCKEAAGL